MISNIKNVVVWGDSVAKGVIFDENRRRYTLSEQSAVKTIAQALDISIQNRAKMGSTITNGLAIMEKDLSTGISADIAILEFGGNDCDFLWQEISDAPELVHLPRTPAEDFEEKMKFAVKRVSQAGMEPYLVNLPPIDAEYYFDFISGGDRSPKNILQWLGDKNHIYRFHERYSCIIERVARATSCKLLDVRSAFLDLWNSRSLLCRDGIHPNEEGQKFIAKAVLAQL